VVGIFLRLKFQLLQNRLAALRRDPKRGQSAVVAVLVLGYFAYRYGGAVYESVSLSGALPDPGPIFAQLSFSIVFLWIVLPLAYGGGRDLDVRKFQLLPVRPIALAGGLASTFILSPGVWLTAAVAAVLAAGFPDAASVGEPKGLSVSARLLERGLTSIAEGRSLYDLRLLAGSNGGAASVEAA